MHLDYILAYKKSKSVSQEWKLILDIVKMFHDLSYMMLQIDSEQVIDSGLKVCSVH